MDSDQTDQTYLSAENLKNDQQPSIYDLFKFASLIDKLILLAGILLASINGATRTVFFLVISLSISSFDIRYTRVQFEAKIFQCTLNFIYLAVAVFIGTICSRTLLRISAQRQDYKFRSAYLKALFQKDINFYENIDPNELSRQVESDCNTIYNALDKELEAICSSIGTIIGALIISFLRSWQISLMMFIVGPFSFVAMGTFYKIVYQSHSERSVAYFKANAIAEEALTNIKTVVSLGGEKTEIKRYTEAVHEAQQTVSKNSIFQGVAFGAIETIFLFCIAIFSYIGSYFIEDGTINPLTEESYIIADINTPLYAIFQAISVVPLFTPNLKGLDDAKVKARKILEVIKQTEISIMASAKIANFTGAITFENVSFAYPTNPNKLVLRNLNFRIEPNTKVAIVGEPGSGKTTITQLLQNFYNLEDEESCIKFDNLDMNNLDVPWLRKNIAYLGKEPVLFSMTIRENLLLGKKDATEDELIQALKKAGAYDFVMNMEHKLDTIIGEGKSTQLSMEQKQRIVIARALLKDARVLILDEATSALDSTSEKEILKTLNNLPGERTVIIIAQWLSAIKNVDQIIVLNEGQIDEIGTYEELMKKEGKYYKIQSIADVSTRSKISDNIQNRYSNIEQYEHEDELEENLPLINEPNLSEEEKQNKKKNSFPFSEISMLWNVAKNEKKCFIFGVFTSLGYALVNPFNSLLTALISSVLLRSIDPDFRQDINLFCLLFMILGVGMFIIVAVEFNFYSNASESLIEILRREVFSKFLRMHIGWHDQPENKPANLLVSLENDTIKAGQIVVTSAGILIQITFSCIVTIIASLLVVWKLALFGALIFPLVMFVAFKVNSNERKSKEEETSLLFRADHLISEAAINIKTLMSFDSREIILKEYNLIIKQYHQVKLETQFANCLLEGGLFVVLYLDFAAIYYYGTYMFLNEEIGTYKIFFVVFAVTFTALEATQLFPLALDIAKAFDSFQQIINYLNMQSQIDIENKSNNYRGEIKGNIEFKDVSFHYPTRKGTVLQNLSFKIDAGRQIGLTGPNGCGKSTIIQLLLRLYDVDSGQILIEGVNIKEYDLTYLRRKIAVVSQEPLLFTGSVEHNLKYANEEISEEEIKEAVLRVSFIKKNDAENTIQSSIESTQLSQEQKEIVVIVRAILRKPTILFFDEATSIFDSERENLALSELKTAFGGITTILVAHQIEKFRELEEILVMNDGTIIERESYQDLIE